MTPRQTCPQPDGFGRNLRSKTRWFTGFCNSHQVSHFATFFIDVRAEISVAESHYKLIKKTTPVRAQREPKSDRRTLFHFPWRIPRRFFVVSGRPGGRKLATGAPPTSNEHRAAPDFGEKGRPPGRTRLDPRVLTTCSRVALLSQVTTMILPQVHLRKPCYDFSFL